MNGLRFLIVIEVTESSQSCQMASRREWVEEAGENLVGGAAGARMSGWPGSEGLRPELRTETQTHGPHIAKALEGGAGSMREGRKEICPETRERKHLVT